MRLVGIEGVRRRRVRTTRPDPGAQRPADLVERDFTAVAPNKLWVADPAYVPTWAGVAYVCFIVDAFSRMIVGWRVAAHMRTQMVLDALEMARASRGTHLGGLVAHTDAGSQPASLRWGQRLAELGAAPSVGSVGDSYDNALAETVNGIYKTELIRGPTGAPAAPSATSNPLTSPGCTGTTTSASTATSETSPRQSSRPPTLPTRPTENRLETNKPSLHKTQGDSHSYTLSPLRRRVVFTNTPPQYHHPTNHTSTCRPYNQRPEPRRTTQNPTSTASPHRHTPPTRQTRARETEPAP